MAVREKNGQFGPGNTFGTGRRVSELRKAFVECITREDVQAIVRAVIEKAKEGDLKAVQIILPFTIGSPMKQNELRQEMVMDEAVETGNSFVLM